MILCAASICQPAFPKYVIVTVSRGVAARAGVMTSQHASAEATTVREDHRGVGGNLRAVV